MKKYLSILTLAFVGVANVKAQNVIEAKINPLGLLFGRPEASVEIGVKDRLSIEPSLIYNNYNFWFTDLKIVGFGGRVIGKYYLNNDLEVDMTRYWVGGYLCAGSNKVFEKDFPANYAINNRFSAGVAFGYKWLAGDNFVIETALGAGRAFVNSFTESQSTNSVDLSEVIPYDFNSTLKLGWRFGDGSSKKHSKKRRRR